MRTADVRKTINAKSYVLISLILFQSLCAVFFVGDVLDDAVSIGGIAFANTHLIVEALATVVLVLAIFFEFQYLMDILRRSARAEIAVRVASGALQDLIEEYFENWGLTPSEKDVALFAMKGLSILEIAELRGSREGTVKTHLNAIYRKADVSGRSQLVSLLVEDLIVGPLVPPTKS